MSALERGNAAAPAPAEPRRRRQCLRLQPRRHSRCRWPISPHSRRWSRSRSTPIGRWPRRCTSARRLGAATIAGIAAVVLALTLFIANNLPQGSAIAALRGQLAQLAPVTKGALAPLSGSALAALPPRGEAPDIVAKILEEARASGVELPRGQYEYVPARDGVAARYRMTFPVHATYPQLREFMDRTLVALPAVAVEGMRIERKAVGDARSMPSCGCRLCAERRVMVLTKRFKILCASPWRSVCTSSPRPDAARSGAVAAPPLARHTCRGAARHGSGTARTRCAPSSGNLLTRLAHRVTTQQGRRSAVPQPVLVLAPPPPPPAPVVVVAPPPPTAPPIPFTVMGSYARPARPRYIS